MAYVIVVALLIGVVFLVTAPWRRPLHVRTGEAVEPPEQATGVIELEAARDAKYREIRDAELDHQTGKLSDSDWSAIDSTLRAEAIEILRQLDRLSGRRARRPDAVRRGTDGE